MSYFHKYRLHQTGYKIILLDLSFAVCKGTQRSPRNGVQKVSQWIVLMSVNSWYICPVIKSNPIVSPTLKFNHLQTRKTNSAVNWVRIDDKAAKDDSRATAVTFYSKVLRCTTPEEKLYLPFFIIIIIVSKSLKMTKTSEEYNRTRLALQFMFSQSHLHHPAT